MLIAPFMATAGSGMPIDMHIEVAGMRTLRDVIDALTRNVDKGN
jgi:hypothetical protein